MDLSLPVPRSEGGLATTHPVTVLAADAGSARSEARLAFLTEAARVLHATLDPEETLRRIARSAVPAFADWAFLTLLDETGPRRVEIAHADPAQADLARRLGAHRTVLRPDVPWAQGLLRGEPLHVPRLDDALLLELTEGPEHLAVARELAPRSLVAVPLRSRGRFLGTLAFLTTTSAREYDRDDVAFAQRVGDLASLALDNALLYDAERVARQEAERSSGRLARLHTVTAALASARDADAVFDALLQHGLRAFEAGAGAVYRVDAAAGRCVLARSVGYDGEAIAPWTSIALDASAPVALCAREGEAVFVRDREELQARFTIEPRSANQAWAALPLVVDGAVAAVLAASFRVPQTFDAGERAFFATLARTCAGALERVRRDEEERRSRDTAELYREIYLNALDGIALIDAEGHYINQNDAHRRLVGYSDAEIEGATPEVHLGREAFAAIAAELERTGRYRGEHTSRRKDGTLLSVDLSAFSVRSADGRFLCHVGVKRDVTARRVVHDLALRAAHAVDAEEIHEAALEAIGRALRTPRASILLFDDDGVMRFKAWRGISDPYRAAVEGHTPWTRDAVAPTPITVADVADDPSLAPYLPLFRREGIAALAFVPLVHRGRLLGKFMVYHAEPHAFTEDEVQLAVTIAGTVASAIDRQRADADLRRSEANLTNFVETASVGLHWVGADGTVLWANRADHDMLGYAREEYVGQDIRKFHVDADVIDEVLRRLLAGESILEFPVRLRHRDGSVRHALLDSSGYFEDGRFIHTRCFTRDVTQRVKAERELELMKAELARNEKLAALGTLVSGVAHEVRTPLTYVANNLFLLQARLERAAAEGQIPAELTRDVVPHATAALDGAERINHLVGELRRYTRMRSGARVVAGLEELVAGAVALFRATHLGRVVVEEHLVPTQPVAVDKLQLQQVVLNLLENAADASRPGGVVRVRTRATPEGARFEVGDEGSGIPTDAQGRIFEPFYTTKEEGTGLGLSIVRRIVEGHGGTVRYETSAKRGTTFIVTFPPERPPGGSP